MKKVKCFCCDKLIDNLEWSSDAQHIQPLDGLAFRTYGHYGSGIFDPISEKKYLDIAICDICLLDKIEKVWGSGVSDIKNNYDKYLEYAKECSANNLEKVTSDLLEGQTSFYSDLTDEEGTLLFKAKFNNLYED